MRDLLRYIYRRFLPLRLKQQIDIFYSLRGADILPKLIDKPAGKNILVLAPHPDDEVIGCGGTLYKHHLAGDKITVVYMTDGSKGAEPKSWGEELAKKRKEEAKEAAKIIGIDELIFLNNPDGELTINKQTLNQIKLVLEKIKPDLVYLPFILERHPDHRITSEIFIKCVKKWKNFSGYCCAYEVWTPLMPNYLVDIGEYTKIKVKALNKFKSQISRVNIIDAALGFAKYRAVLHTGLDTFVEAFLFCKIKEYLKLYKLIKK
ncbi:MAG: hypothetical protein DRG20_06795 [Deltaproteobacteria bacterium]|nr:MAG: hypothetical protein DRG20_06795 [Deltaproteobacteria bacterium]